MVDGREEAGKREGRKQGERATAPFRTGCTFQLPEKKKRFFSLLEGTASR